MDVLQSGNEKTSYIIRSTFQHYDNAGMCVTTSECQSQSAAVNPSFTHHLSESGTGLQESEAKAIPELNINANEDIVIDGNSYSVSDGYISAMGNQCYRLKRQGRSGSTEVRPICNNQTYWLLYPALVFSNTL